MTILITGANRGLGFETAKALAQGGSRQLVLAGRDLGSLQTAVAKITAATGNDNLHPMHLDLADLASVRAFAGAYRDTGFPDLQVLICNAGLTMPDIGYRSADGYELTFAVNHLGHFLLTHLLLSQMAHPARIIFVSSGVHDPTQTAGPMQPPRYSKAEWLAFPDRDPDTPAAEKIAAGEAYANSKLSNLLCAYELARQLTNLPGPAAAISVNAFDPGLVAGTGLGRHGKGMTRFIWFVVMPLMSRLISFGRTAARSGGDLAWLATDPALTNTSARYFSGREMLDSSPDSYDLKKAADLWQTSIRLTKLKPEETILPITYSEQDEGIVG